jgi:HTH-type transcriptional regulator/antitoxin HipB
MNYTINTLDQLKPILVGYRKSNGLSQKALAAKLGISQQTYQTLESNPQKVTIERLFNVLTLLGGRLSLSYIVNPSIKNQRDDW